MKKNRIITSNARFERSWCECINIRTISSTYKNHLPVDRFVHPDEFNEYREIGLQMGFDIVESGPLVRSSYHAERHI